MSGSGSHRPLDFGVSLALIAVLVVGGLIILFNLLLARSLIRRITHQEIITVDATSLSLTDKHLFGKKKRSFKLEHIGQISTAGVENFTPHPLEGNYADIGFRGREGMVRYLITDGNIVMSYGKRSIQFGKNVPSWDVEEIIEAIERYTGRNFSPKIKPETEIVRPTKYRGQM